MLLTSDVSLSGIESLPLVERLFADLLHTTESLKNAKLSYAKSPREKADIEAQVEPYKVGILVCNGKEFLIFLYFYFVFILDIWR